VPVPLCDARRSGGGGVDAAVIGTRARSHPTSPTTQTRHHGQPRGGVRCVRQVERPEAEPSHHSNARRPSPVSPSGPGWRALGRSTAGRGRTR
jgi:hypothetical protein